MKKTKKLIWLLLVAAAVIGLVVLAWNRFGKETGGDITHAPTVMATVAPTESTEPTAEPTKEPAATETPTPTETPEATNSPVPAEEPTPESTAEPTEAPAPTVEPTATPTAEPTPTEIPVHEHVWEKKEVKPACAEGGRTWEECACGEIQNEVILEALGHGELVYQVVTEPTVEAEGAYEETCSVCKEVINRGAIEKLKPTPTPSPTATPVPTSTPTPTPTGTPTPTPTPVATPTPKPQKGKGYLRLKKASDSDIEFKKSVYDYEVVLEIINRDSCYVYGEKTPATECFILNNDVADIRLESGYDHKLKITPKNNGETDILVTLYAVDYNNTKRILEVLNTVVIHITVDVEGWDAVISTPAPTPSPKPTATPFPVRENPYFTLESTSSNEIVMDSLNEKILELDINNISFELERTPNYQTPEGKTILAKLTYTNEEVVRLENMIGKDKYSFTCEDSGRLKFRIIPLSAGTSVVTATLQTMDADGTNISDVLDTIEIKITVEEFKSNVVFKETDYNPIKNGYRTLIGEWQCGDNAYAGVWWNGKEKNDGGRAVLVITGEGDMWKKAEYGESSSHPWSLIEKENLVKEVYVCEGITSAGSYLGGMGTEKISLPSTLKRVEEYAFYRADITELHIPDTVEYIGEDAFSCCDKLDTIVLPIRLRYLGTSAFSKNWTPGYDDHVYVREIILPETLEYIGPGAFSYRWGNTFVIPEGHNISSWDEEWFSYDGYEPRIEYR